MLINTSTGPGAGITGLTIQFHGTANQYTLEGATAIATLYSDANTATLYPAVTINNSGSNGGKAIAFTYDLSKSVVYTRQGNPAWAGQNRDQQAGPIRANDMFYGDAPGDPQPDWIDLNKVAIPQADEQQRLLANIIIKGNMHRKPLPRFWFLPRKLKAAVVMTGDDHANGATVDRFNQYLTKGPNTPQDILDWNAIRGTSYIYYNTSTSAISNAQADAFEEQGFEISVHVDTGCENWTSESQLNNSFYTPQMAIFEGKWPDLLAPSTHRTHCIAWSDWASQAKVQASKGIRLDANYYYWPGSWVQNRPGMFTGSGMPMRFADIDGSLIDCYQVTTQLTDESDITYSTHINSLLDKAVGSEGFYGIFCANMHTDVNGGNSTQGSDAIIASAQARNIPVISAKQMLTWLDARNSSSFGSITWSSNTLNFSVAAAVDAYKLQGIIPVIASVGQLTGIKRNGTPISYTTEVIKGINYAFFDATTGNYVATYLTDDTGPVITDVVATPGTGGTATITWTTDEASDSRVDYGTTMESLNPVPINLNLVTSHTITITGLTQGLTYYYRVISKDILNNSTTYPEESSDPSNFTMPTGPCASDVTAADFNAGTTGTNTIVIPDGDGAVSLKPILNEEFSGSSIPSGWNSEPWAEGGTTTLNGGKVNVDGAHIYCNIAFGPVSCLEFYATYSAGNFQNIGFSGTAQFGEPWVVIGRRDAVNNDVYARTHINQDGESLGTNLANSPHLYRIQRVNSTNDFEFYVDGILKTTLSLTSVPTSMFIQVSDAPVGGPSLSVDWIRLLPYATPGTFTSRIFDAYSEKTWGAASWTADIPAGTALQLSQRQSNSEVDILIAPWIVISTNGANIGGTSQYFQYKADFTASNTALTPVLKDVSINCSTPSNSPPEVTTHPLSQTKCAGENVSFISTASGYPVPTVQWQISLNNGTTWSDIALATNPTYTFTTNIADNGKKYKAIWSNGSIPATSNAATLNVNPPPTASIIAVTNPVCPGANISLQLANAPITSSYTIVVNGTTYTNVAGGQTFATFNTAELSIWGSTGSPTSGTDNKPIEVGTKFRTTLSGYITGVRFYKGLTNTGTHVAHLWTREGTQLAEATFTSETASGWQEVRFTNPVAIQANTTYIASYFSPSGYFARDGEYFQNKGETNGPLTALQSGVDGVNGVLNMMIAVFQLMVTMTITGWMFYSLRLIRMIFKHMH